MIWTLFGFLIFHSGCLEIAVDACQDALWPLTGTTSSNLTNEYDRYTAIPGFPTCHPDAIRSVCSLHAVPCGLEPTTYPCRSTCLQVAHSCFKANDTSLYRTWVDDICNKLPESNDEEICFSPSHPYTPGKKSRRSMLKQRRNDAGKFSDLDNHRIQCHSGI